MSEDRPPTEERRPEEPSALPQQAAESEEAPVVVAEVVEEERGPIDPHALGLELPEDPTEALQLVLRELADARDEAGAYLDDLQRVAADFDNFRKRALRDHAANIERASEHIVKSLLPVLDTLDAALASGAETTTEQQLLDGIRGTRDLLLDTLGKEGLELIPALGEDFDPRLHEAVAAPQEGQGHLVVAQELRRGYLLKGRVLRAALVAVDHE